jgi:hypothetical protein
VAPNADLPVALIPLSFPKSITRIKYCFLIEFSKGLSPAWAINITFDGDDQTGIYQHKGAGSS